MKYKFSYQTTAFDFWQLSMYQIYGSMVGVCNIIFTVAMILLTIKFWGMVNGGVKILLVLASCWFIVIQPIIVYIRAKKQIAGSSKNMEIQFNDKGIHVQIENQSSHLKWSSIRRIAKKPTMIVIFSTKTHGFILTNKVLGRERESFYHYIVSKIEV